MSNNKVKHRVPQETPAKGIIQFQALRDDPPAYDEIAVLAYSYWEARSGNGGSAEEDWLRAEEEVRKRHRQMRTSQEQQAAVKGIGA
jgi:DUF2934 family protein